MLPDPPFSIKQLYQYNPLPLSWPDHRSGTGSILIKPKVAERAIGGLSGLRHDNIELVPSDWFDIVVSP